MKSTEAILVFSAGVATGSLLSLYAVAHLLKRDYPEVVRDMMRKHQK